MKLRYGNFVDDIDIDAVEDAIGFDAIDSTDTEDRGHCFDIWGLHKNGDTTGKLSIHREKMVYNCWVCGGGSILSLVMDLKDMDVGEATRWLYEFAEQEDEEKPDKLLGKVNKIFGELDPPQKKDLPYFNERVLDKWLDTRTSWFRKRGINNDTRQEFKLGYDPTHVRRKNDEEYVGPAIIIPHFWGGKLVGWQERWLDENRPKWVAKYTNTPDFPKESTLFNYDKCLSNSHVEPVVVESPVTALFLDSIRVPAIATFGSNLPESQIQLLRVFNQGVFLSPDNDKPKGDQAAAGIKWRDTLTESLIDTIPVYHVPLVTERGESADLGNLAPRDDLVYDYIERAYTPITDVLARMR